MVAQIQIGLQATLLTLIAQALQARLDLAHAGLQFVLAQAHQHLTGRHPLALFHQALADLGAQVERQLGAPAGLERTGAGIGHQGLDRTALHHDQPHRQRLRSAPPPEQRRQAQQQRHSQQHLAHRSLPSLGFSLGQREAGNNAPSQGISGLAFAGTAVHTFPKKSKRGAQP
ncbi:hypothetical protein D3C86_1427710 [compost metagenome]